MEYKELIKKVLNNEEVPDISGINLMYLFRDHLAYHARSDGLYEINLIDISDACTLDLETYYEITDESTADNIIAFLDIIWPNIEKKIIVIIEKVPYLLVVEELESNK